jgi:hypothetical protein
MVFDSNRKGIDRAPPTIQPAIRNRRKATSRFPAKFESARSSLLSIRDHLLIVSILSLVPSFTLSIPALTSRTTMPSTPGAAMSPVKTAFSSPAAALLAAAASRVFFVACVFRPGLSLAHPDRSATHIGIIETGYCRLAFRGRAHDDKAEAPGSASLLVLDDSDGFHLSEPAESAVHILFGEREQHIADIQFHHCLLE